MLKRAGVVVAFVALGAVSWNAALAGAAKTKKHNCKVDVTALVATVRVISGNPPVSGSQEDAGTVDGKICGKAFHGAVRSVDTFTSPGVFNINSVTFGPVGSTNAKGTATGTLNPDGSASFSGKGKFVGGTGVSKGATGSFTFTGTQPKNGPAATQHIVGTLKY
jgi:hypothetical protein